MNGHSDKPPPVMSPMNFHTAGLLLRQALPLYQLRPGARVLEVPTLSRHGAMESSLLTRDFAGAFQCVDQLVDCAQKVAVQANGRLPCNLAAGIDEGTRQPYLARLATATELARYSKTMLLSPAPTLQETLRRAKIFYRAQDEQQNRHAEMNLTEFRSMKALGGVLHKHGYSIDIIRNFRRSNPRTLDVSFSLIGFNGIATWQNRIDSHDPTNFLVSMSLYVSSWPEFYALFHDWLPLDSEQDFNAATVSALSAYLYRQDQYASSKGFKLTTGKQRYLIFPNQLGISSIFDQGKYVSLHNVQLARPEKSLESVESWGREARPSFSLLSDERGVMLRAHCPLNYDSRLFEFLRAGFERLWHHLKTEVETFDGLDPFTQELWLHSALFATGHRPE